ncbi:hypothetical protein JANAI62_03540 [Jannaschia pagri]|uniref:Uncharacterized protein n=1 Tax=Jannaschia pagri TaxID=2829797 RepID=A0ABQ4NH40_9RHOB|nr:hypothetical protein JANAI61_06210 [Jannaschia sp. AI_61]GIT93731.1 hypothetical protein JANAI62_03540 [Jannaschia sp. AI_62]
MTAEPFTHAARLQTMRSDFDRLRKLVKSWAAYEEIEQAWDRIEPWLDQLQPKTAPSRYRHREGDA